MSALAGVLLAAGTTVPDGMVPAMLERMAHRAPDGIATWRAGAAALGLGLLRTLPEDPATAEVASLGDLVAVADARLDNRAALLRELAPPGAAISDTALILLAFQRWREETPIRLLGDFAFAVFDSRNAILFAARDPLGVKPFYYRLDGGLAFASEPKALFRPGSPFAPIARGRIDEARVADHLRAALSDREGTFYDALKRLPPGHSLAAATGRQPAIAAYWQAHGRRPEDLPADDAAAFRALFADAVRSRLRSAGPVAALLSGGLDSSSIACTAAALRQADGEAVDTFSMVFDATPQWSERPFIEAVLAAGAFRPHFVACDDYAPFAGFDRLLAEQDAVFSAPGLANSGRVYEAARSRGFRVILDGHGGDEVVSHGAGRLADLAAAGRWRSLWREAGGIAALYRLPTWRLWTLAVLRHGRFRGAYRLRRLLSRLAGRSAESSAFVNPALLARAEALRKRHAPPARTATSEHAATVASPLQAHALEVLDLLAAARGVEARYPFLDRRLVEFCLALPAEAKLCDGWTRFVLRRAMEGLLPAGVQWRRDKLDFSPHMITGMLREHVALIDGIIERDVDGVGAYAHLPAVRAAYRRLKAAGVRAAGRDVQAVWRTVALSLWLRELNGTEEPVR